MTLCQRAKIVLDFAGFEPLELAALVANADLNVGLVHLALEGLLQRQDRRVDGVVELELLVVTTLQKGTRIVIVLA